MYYNLPGSFIHGMFQHGENSKGPRWNAVKSPFPLSSPATQVSPPEVVGFWFLRVLSSSLCTHVMMGIVKVLAVQSCPTVCTPMDCSLPGSSVHGFLQARILEWVAIPYSKEYSQWRDQTQVFWIAGRFFMVWVTRDSNTTNTTYWELILCELVFWVFYVYYFIWSL